VGPRVVIFLQCQSKSLSDRDIVKQFALGVCTVGYVQDLVSVFKDTVNLLSHVRCQIGYFNTLMNRKLELPRPCNPRTARCTLAKKKGIQKRVWSDLILSSHSEVCILKLSMQSSLYRSQAKHYAFTTLSLSSRTIVPSTHDTLFRAGHAALINVAISKVLTDDTSIRSGGQRRTPVKLSSRGQRARYGRRSLCGFGWIDCKRSIVTI